MAFLASSFFANSTNAILESGTPRRALPGTMSTRISFPKASNSDSIAPLLTPSRIPCTHKVGASNLEVISPGCA